MVWRTGVREAAANGSSRSWGLPAPPPRNGQWPRFLVGLACIGLAWPAIGATGEHSVVTGLGYHRLSWRPGGASDGLGVLVGYRYGLADDWNLQGSAGLTGFLNPQRRFSLVTATVGVAYLVDALTFVPEIRVGVGYVGPATQGAVKPDVGLLGGVALEYRRYRSFGVGVVAEYRYLIRNREDIGGVLSVTLYVSRYF